MSDLQVLKIIVIELNNAFYSPLFGRNHLPDKRKRFDQIQELEAYIIRCVSNPPVLHNV